MLRKLSRRQFAIAAALMCVGCAAQTSSSKTRSQTFNSIDTDGNGSLSQQELHSWADENKDNEVSLEEWNKLEIDPADD
jgi:hypothetical protein